jgi:hypothetical protein
VKGFANYDEDNIDRSAHKQFYDGLKSYPYPKVGSDAFRPESSEITIPIIKSPSRKSRLNTIRNGICRNDE